MPYSCLVRCVSDYILSTVLQSFCRSARVPDCLPVTPSISDRSWKNGDMHGKGKLQLPAGETMEGDWFNSKIVYGLETSLGGLSYTGEFNDNKKHGKGTLTFPDGSSYRGDFLDGRMHGVGTFTTSDGSTFEGEYEHDRRHGRGTLTAADGHSFRQVWHAGTLEHNQDL